MTRAGTKENPDRRAQIIAAAFDEFAAGGYQQASLRSIAAKVGITHPGVLYHFRSKEELLVAVLREHEEAERRVFHDDEPVRDLPDFRARLVGAFRGELRRPQLLRLRVYLASECNDDDGTVGHQWIAERYERIVREMADQFEAFIRSGELPEDFDISGRSAALFAFYDGLLAHALSCPDVDVPRMFDSAIEHILYGSSSFSGSAGQE